MRQPSGAIGRGVVAGIIGAITLAVWFLIIDAIRRTLFYTPTFVASVLLGLDGAQPSVGVLAIYTIIHFAAFIAVGIVVSWLLDRLTIPPVMLLGFGLGFLLFDLIFYAGIIMRGANVVRELGWPTVLVGNVITGIVMMQYLYWASPVKHESIRDLLRAHRTIREGLIAGLIGAATVMLWFLVVDVGLSRLLFTPAALGSALFFGASNISQVQVTPETVLGYTGVHLIAFMFVGLVASALVEGARREPHLLLGVVLLFVTLEVLSIGLLAILATWLLDSIKWWMVVGGNLASALVMGGFLLYKHPEVRQNLSHNLEEELVS